MSQAISQLQFCLIPSTVSTTERVVLTSHQKQQSQSSRTGSSTNAGIWFCLNSNYFTHRIIESLRLEGTPRIIKFQTPCHRQGHQPPDPLLDQAVQGSIQPGLEHLQGWSIHSLSGQPVPASHHSLCEEIRPDIQSRPSLLSYHYLPT